MADKICGVYKITNIVNGKFYIGSSHDIEHRWYQHKKQLDSETHNNPHLQNAWKLYGSQNFKFEIIEECSSETRLQREQFYLNELMPFDNNGYNIVRQTSKECFGEHYIEKVCSRCFQDYTTLSRRSKYCDKCREEIQKNFLENRRNGYCLSAKAEEEGYENYMKRCQNAPLSWWYD
jgi:group I intron endonuclease